MHSGRRNGAKFLKMVILDGIALYPEPNQSGKGRRNKKGLRAECNVEYPHLKLIVNEDNGTVSMRPVRLSPIPSLADVR